MRTSKCHKRILAMERAIEEHRRTLKWKTLGKSKLTLSVSTSTAFCSSLSSISTKSARCFDFNRFISRSLSSTSCSKSSTRVINSSLSFKPWKEKKIKRFFYNFLDIILFKKLPRQIKVLSLFVSYMRLCVPLLTLRTRNIFLNTGKLKRFWTLFQYDFLYRSLIYDSGPTNLDPGRSFFLTEKKNFHHNSNILEKLSFIFIKKMENFYCLVNSQTLTLIASLRFFCRVSTSLALPSTTMRSCIASYLNDFSLNSFCSEEF